MFRIKFIDHPWDLRKLLHLSPASPMDAIRRNIGVNGLREAYRENLEIALRYVYILCREILRFEPRSNIVITSDHGELLENRESSLME
jgi:hypothetical protein